MLYEEILTRAKDELEKEKIDTAVSEVKELLGEIDHVKRVLSKLETQLQEKLAKEI